MSGQEKPYWSRIEESIYQYIYIFIYLFKHVCLQAESHNDPIINLGITLQFYCLRAL